LAPLAPEISEKRAEQEKVRLKAGSNEKIEQQDDRQQQKEKKRSSKQHAKVSFSF
jgi:hypothetical protein